MSVLEVTIPLHEDLHELLIAELVELDFDTFLQEEAYLKAYIPARHWTQVKREQVAAWLRRHGATDAIVEQEVKEENWNARWEASVEPIAIGHFVVAPTWAEVPSEHAEKYLLRIDPKMSFGTGYHASTRLVLRFLPSLVMPGDRVLDAGSGTGVLAIAALKLGAAHAIAFDIDPWAQENAVENFQLNGLTDAIDFRCGGIETVPEDGFDLVLANINRNVLLAYLPDFAQRTRPEGYLVLAGLLLADRSRMLAAAEQHGFTSAQEDSEGEWWSVVLQRNAGRS